MMVNETKAKARVKGPSARPLGPSISPSHIDPIYTHLPSLSISARLFNAPIELPAEEARFTTPVFGIFNFL